jgi:hypothetical protein
VGPGFNLVSLTAHVILAKSLLLWVSDCFPCRKIRTRSVNLSPCDYCHFPTCAYQLQPLLSWDWDLAREGQESYFKVKMPYLQDTVYHQPVLFHFLLKKKMSFLVRETFTF